MRLRSAPLLCSVLLAACQPTPEAGWTGYAEGEYRRIAAPLAGRLAELPVAQGQEVAAGALLFALSAEPEAAARAEGRARAEAAREQARDADTGRRADELAVTRAQLAQAEAQAALARSNLSRDERLSAQGFVSPARLGDLRAARDQAEARVRELQAAVRVAALPGRPAARSAARASADAAEQAERQLAWRLDQARQRAPLAAQVSDVYFRVGEWVPAGQPVLALLPPGAVVARFYVSQAEAGALQPGQAVQVACDGCGAPQTARIRAVASQPEYTPPVIYSAAQRQRLVFRVEAVGPPGQPLRLHPGQPIDVRRALP